MNRKQMEYFTEVCHSRNIQTAAENLQVSRQGVSRVIRDLEEEFGTALFVRRPRGLEPTDYASELLVHVYRLLGEYQAIDGMSSLAAQARNLVTLYAIDHVPAYLGAEFFLRLRGEYPQLMLSTVEGTDDAVLAALLERRCDLAIAAGPWDRHRLEGRPLFFSHYCLRLAADHPLAGRECIRFADLAGQKIIGKGRAYHCFRHKTDAFILSKGIRIDLLAETADESLTCDLIRQAGAIAIGYDYSIDRAHSDGIVTRPLGDDPDGGELFYLLRERARHLSAAGARLWDFLPRYVPAVHKEVVRPGRDLRPE